MGVEMLLNSFMDPIILIGLALPLAYLHGHFTGRKHGINLGAARMYDEIWRNGTKTSKKGVRKVELENECD
jgi:hypothetical protein